MANAPKDKEVGDEDGGEPDRRVDWAAMLEKAIPLAAYAAEGDGQTTRLLICLMVALVVQRLLTPGKDTE